MSREMEFATRAARELVDLERKAWAALAKYKFWMFGYWAARWIALNSFAQTKLPNPFKILVHVAKAVLRGHTITITVPPVAPSRREA